MLIRSLALSSLALISSGASALFAQGFVPPPPFIIDTEFRVLNSVIAPGLRFGEAVGIDDPFAVIGVPGDDSAVVYQRVGETWSAVDRLLPFPSVSNNAVFGSFVAIDGDRIAVTADMDQFGILSTPGSVHVYVRSGNGWNLEQRLTIPAVPSFSFFGRALALEGDTLAVGRGGLVGVVHIFQRVSGSWSEVQTIDLALPSASIFRFSLAMDGDWLAIGTPTLDTLPEVQLPDGTIVTNTNSGAVYLYRRDAQGVWQRSAKLLPETLSFLAEFGASIAISGSRIAVGAPGDGTVHVFDRAHGVWSESAVLAPSAPRPLARFGDSVALEGDRLVVGTDTSEAHATVGVFDRIGGTWREVAEFDSREVTPDSPHPVGLSGSTILVGAPEDDLVATDFGAASFVKLRSHHSGTFCVDPTMNPNCSPCPCGNQPDVSSFGGCLNSQGWSATLEMQDRFSPFPDPDDLRITLRGMTPNSFAFLVSGTMMPDDPLSPCPSYGVQSNAFDGLRCVSGTITRHGTRSSDAFGDIGRTNQPWGPAILGQPSLLSDPIFSTASGGLPFFHFQAIYRDDPADVCGTGFNTTNGVRGLLLGPGW